MARLPQPGGDSGNWGAILNDYLIQSHNNDGTIKAGSVTTATIADGAVTAEKLSASSPVNGQILTYAGGELDWSAPATKTPIIFSAATATTGVTATDRAYTNRTLTGARMRVAAAPVGSSLTVDVQHYDGNSWTTVSTLTIASGSTVEAVTSFTQTQTVGNLLRLNITSVGSSTAASGVAVDITWN